MFGHPDLEKKTDQKKSDEAYNLGREFWDSMYKIFENIMYTHFWYTIFISQDRIIYH